MKKYPLVSVIMNCHNGEKYLKESIESVLFQTYENWELIFWDNKSEDESKKIFKSYTDKRLRYFYSEKYTSLYQARNLAIEKSKGDFIAFLDTDDMWEKNKLELQMPYFQNPEVGLVFTNQWIIKKNKKNKKIFSKKKLPSGKIYNQLINNYNVGILTTVIRKKFYEKLEKKFDNRYSIIGDFDLFLRLSKICSFESVQQPLAFYRIHGQNFSINFKEKEIEETKMWLNENKLQLTETQFKKIEKENFYREFINCKLYGNYKDAIIFLLNPKKNLFNLKNFVILFIPNIMLKKLLWFH